ncbi:MAG TPA: class I SAM-dependent methyltransferase [Gemmatimonadales bacterium]|jgi:2-polyprenyl-3-methyl-5-hydroxy-6-metoxy-1,4-benzoquinol methylase
MNRRTYWDRIYRNTSPDLVSWYQPEPTLSLDLIRQAVPDRSSSILDVGGGASTLVDGLLAAGYHRLTVLDLSGVALAAARTRVGEAAALVTWLEADLLTMRFAGQAYDLWHDRAVFHFLTDPADRRRYAAQARHAVRPGGHVLIATFAPDAPPQCSGLEVARYSPEALQSELGAGFRLLGSHREEHHTPGGRTQAFNYCHFRIGDAVP